MVKRRVCAIVRESVACVALLLRHDGALDVLVVAPSRQRDLIATPVPRADVVCKIDHF